MTASWGHEDKVQRESDALQESFDRKPARKGHNYTDSTNTNIRNQFQPVRVTCFFCKFVLVGGRTTCYSKVFLVRSAGGHWLKQCKQFLISNLAATPTARSFYLTIWLGGSFKVQDTMHMPFEVTKYLTKCLKNIMKFNNTIEDSVFVSNVIELSCQFNMKS